MERVHEIAAALDHLREVETVADGHRIQAAIARVRRAMIAFGGALAPGGPSSVELLDAFYALVYPRLLRAYQAAGYPCGPDEEAMWQWLRQQAAIAAEAERVEFERAWQRGLAALRREIEVRRGDEPAGAGALVGARRLQHWQSQPRVPKGAGAGALVGERRLQRAPGEPESEGGPA